MERLLANWYIYIYDNLYTQTGTYEKLTTYSDAIMSTLGPNGSMHQAYLTMRIIAFGILTVFFVITLGTRLEGREMSPSVIFKTLLEFFVGYVLALFSFEIVRGMFIVGDWMASVIMDTTVQDPSSFEEFTTAFMRSIENLGFTAQVIYAFKALIPYIACVVANIIITYAILTRVLRICINAVMSPIAIANFFDGSRHSDGARFLKRTLSMCLQCSVIMIITAAVASLSGFMTSDSVYSDSLKMESAITNAKNDMIDSAENDYAALSNDVFYAADKLGYKAYQGLDLKDDVAKARLYLSTKADKVTSDHESEYKGYENKLDIKVFQRDKTTGHYIYDSDGHAKLYPKYTSFTPESMKKFMDALLGGNNYIIFIMLLVIKVGLIKQSNSLCNVIVGL